MEKVRYELDPHNRLTAAGGSLRGTRKVIDGQFKILEHNTLSYHVKSPIPAGLKAPYQMKLKGEWSLTEDHCLRLTLDKWSRQTFGDQLTLQGEILDVRKNSLLFAVTTRTDEDMPSTYILELAGAWQADERNRITFRVEKEHGLTDSLTFNGVWQIDENYRITYTYQQEKLTRKYKKIHTLTFDGHWDIRDKARLSYVIDSESGSGFDFNTSIGIFKDGYIKYELGVGIARTITFTGKWKLNKNIGLVFEVEREGRKIQEIVFGAEAKLTGKGTVVFNLKNSLNKGIGAQLELSRDIFSGDGQAFLRLLESKQESAIMAGVGWRW